MIERVLNMCEGYKKSRGIHDVTSSGKLPIVGMAEALSITKDGKTQ